MIKHELHISKDKRIHLFRNLRKFLKRGYERGKCAYLKRVISYVQTLAWSNLPQSSIISDLREKGWRNLGAAFGDVFRDKSGKNSDFFENF